MSMMKNLTLPVSELEQKIQKLGEQKMTLESEMIRLKNELSTVYQLNSAMNNQISELSNELENQKATQLLRESGQQQFTTSTKQRINELVKEIDECLLLLNK
jgi:predicted  nucleic acid-binding Zn-ribbon protein